MRTVPLPAVPGWTNVSREVGGLSPADAAPPKPVALAVTTVPDGDGRQPRCRSASIRRRQTASPRTRGKWPPER